MKHLLIRVSFVFLMNLKVDLCTNLKVLVLSNFIISVTKLNLGRYQIILVILNYIITTIKLIKEI